MEAPAGRGGAGMSSCWAWLREAAQVRKSRARLADGPVRSHWSMSPCWQAVKVVWRLRSQASRLAAARMLLRAFAVGVRAWRVSALARRRRITCQVA